MAESSFSRSRGRLFLYAAVAIIIGGAATFFALHSPRSRERYVQPAWAGKEWPPNTPVRTVAVLREDLPRHLKAIGTVTPLNTVTVRSRVSGQVLRVTFEEGQRVEKGQLLAEIDPSPYKIQLAQAEGQLEQNAARLRTARTDFERLQGLHTKNLISNQELEAQQALVAQYEGVQVTDQAQVDNAKLQLAWTRIEAPISGRAGMRRIDPGNLIVANDTNGIVVITQMHPMSVVFTIPEVNLPEVLGPFRANQTLSVEAWDRNETNVMAKGVLKTVDNEIDTTTGTLKLRAEFTNDDERLFPNQFVNVRLQLGSLTNAIVIPAAAIQFGSRGTYVYVVNDQGKAKVRDIVLGPADGDLQAVTKGLKPGEQVVTDGIDRLRDGRNVVIVNDAAGGSARTSTATSAP